jgi:hypothetical protein
MRDTYSKSDRSPDLANAEVGPIEADIEFCTAFPPMRLSGPGSPSD